MDPFTKIKKQTSEQIQQLSVLLRCPSWRYVAVKMLKNLTLQKGH